MYIHKPLSFRTQSSQKVLQCKKNAEQTKNYPLF